MNKIRFILAIPFAIVLAVLMVFTAFIIQIGVMIRRGSYAQGKKAMWEYLSTIEKMKL